MVRTLIILNMIIFLTIRWTTSIRELYGFIVFLSNACIGGILVATPTYSMIAFGPVIGSRLYSYFFLIISAANFLQYIYVVFLTKLIGFDNVFWIVFGCLGCLIPLVVFYSFQEDWGKYIAAPTEDPSSHQIKVDDGVHKEGSEEVTKSASGEGDKNRSGEPATTIVIQINASPAAAQA